MNEAAPLKGASLAITAVALALGTFMQVLDLTIANVSLPTIAGNLGASTDQSTWIITSFVVANGIGVPLTGWLMARFGVVRTFLWSVAAFTAASLLCGLAWSLESLVAFRALQGIVSGPMIPGSQALMIAIFPRDRRAMALAVWSITSLTAPVCGPILGGYICDNLHWGWIFLINVPVGVLVVLLCRQNLAGRDLAAHPMRLDTIGLGLLVVWAGALQILLDRGKNADWFASDFIVALGVIAFIGFCAFLWWEITEDHPIIDLSLFRQRNFALGTLVFCLGNSVFLANMLVLPLWLQTQLGYTATWAGLASAPAAAVAVVLTPLVARAMSRFDARLIASAAFLAAAASYYLRASLTNDASFWAIAFPMAVQGIANAGFFVAALSILLDGIPAERIPMASGLSNFARIIASGFAVSIVTTLWDRREALHQSRLADMATGPVFDRMREAMEGQGMSGGSGLVAMARGLEGQAYLLASIDIFTLSMWLSLALTGLVWLCHRARAAGVPAPMD
jgi:DHA2 family multidrug resistance protein